MQDEELPLKATLLAHGFLQPFDTKGSAVPAITFSLLLDNLSGNASVEVGNHDLSCFACLRQQMSVPQAQAWVTDSECL